MRRRIALIAVVGGLLGALPPASSARADDDEVSPGTASDRVPHLVGALRTSGSFKARAMAAVALGRIGDPRAASALADALRSDDHYAVRVAAASALGRLPTPDAVPALLGGILDADQFVREEAQAALDRFHTPTSVHAFKEALHAEDPASRLAAVRAYGDVMRNSPGVAPVVILALGDDHEEVRRAAETAMSGIPHERAVPLLVEALGSGGSAVRAASARLLEKRADKTAVDPLILVMTSPDEGAEARAAARKALRAHRDYLDLPARATAALSTLPEERGARATALRVLAAVDDAAAVEVIDKALKDDDATVRVAAARAASDLGGDRGKKLLDAARAKESDPRMQRQLDLLIKSTR